MTRRRRARRLLLPLVIALTSLAAQPSPVASGPRPPLETGEGLADPWQAARPHADTRFATLPYLDPQGRTGTWVVSDVRLPLRVVVERQIVDRFGLDAVTAALTAWNGVPGSRFAIDVTGVVDTGLSRKRRDGVSRVFLDQADCDGDYLARAHLHPGQAVERYGVLTNYLWEADIGICPRMTAARLYSVVRHEVAHVAGLGHLCDPGDECHVPEMGDANRCRVMYPAAYSCQEPRADDQVALISLYPRLPRIPTAGQELGPAAASRFAFRRHRSVSEAVLLPHGAEPRTQVEAALLAGVRGGVVLRVSRDCTSGPGGVELNRVLSVHARATLVGDVSESCAVELQHGWQLEVERLASHEAVVEAIADELDGPTTAIVVAEGEQALADAVVALPVAVRRGALLLRADRSGLTEHATQVLRSTDVERVLIVGSAFLTNRQVEADLVDLRLPYERVDSGDRVLTALGLWLDPAISSPPPTEVLLASPTQESLLTTAFLAAATRWPVVLTPSDSLDGRVAASLSASASGGVVVGDERALTPEVQVRASRAVDS